MLDALCYARGQLRDGVSRVRICGDVAHLELLDDCLADPFDLGVEGEHVYGTLGGGVGEGIGL